MGKLLSGMWATVLLAGMSAAQQLGVTDGILIPGQKVTVTYSDPGRAGTTIQVQVTGGDPDNPTVVLLPIQLNAQGQGEGYWIALNWWGATFNAPGVNQETRAIDGPEDGADCEV
jgi:hypothetical protein